MHFTCTVRLYIWEKDQSHRERAIYRERTELVQDPLIGAMAPLVIYGMVWYGMIWFGYIARPFEWGKRWTFI
jgi:hypothetical protein